MVTSHVIHCTRVNYTIPIFSKTCTWLSNENRSCGKIFHWINVLFFNTREHVNIYIYSSKETSFLKPELIFLISFILIAFLLIFFFFFLILVSVTEMSHWLLDVNLDIHEFGSKYTRYDWYNKLTSLLSLNRHFPRSHHSLFSHCYSKYGILTISFCTNHSISSLYV